MQLYSWRIFLFSMDYFAIWWRIPRRSNYKARASLGGVDDGGGWKASQSYFPEKW